MTDPTPAWNDAWTAVGARADEALLAELLQRYREPHRKYHTLQHLNECFARFELLREAAVHPAEIAIALWFHDAFYDVTRDDNERLSAQWAKRTALDAGAGHAIAHRLHELVMVTRHDALATTHDEQILVDVDLSILGAAPERFDEYEQQVREEYAHVPQPLFSARRRAILEAFLGRDRIFGTEQFAALLEERARDNLSRSVERLAG
ncbi:N-methyl-D-aspartate receptor NMDAR2C subunit [Piscinibacter sp. XHJ-5]|uniref:HD domain-containing protein n=1 Tax=Piscinibacter sp. XHJ-5 TaxID=3037797 RepID=UPI0024528F3F|nr:N-methyl-D-aspartate receptor NMDAR2C subunit [Piscinibacter sp. XHJ-5]